MILNGIDEIAVRPDLAERSLIVDLPKIASDRRMDEARFWTEFEAAAPRILGVLLDGVSAALRNVERVELAETPRMADFARWVTAAEPALGWAPGTILSAYLRNRADANADALERDALASAILRLLRTEGSISSTPTMLYAKLSLMADGTIKRADTWPGSPSALGSRLRRIAPLLRAAGYEVTDRRTKTERTITIARVSALPSSPSSPSPAAGESAGAADGDSGDGGDGDGGDAG
jgi:hypothetical protein